MRYVGQNTPRKEGESKLIGTAKYIDDITFPDLLYGITVRSEIPRGKILDIQFGDEINWNEFIIVTPKDIPGSNYVALIEKDQPLLAETWINHPEEPLLLLAHPDKGILHKAVEAIEVKTEALPSVLTLEESETNHLTIWGKDNTFKKFLIESKTNPLKKTAGDVTFEGVYETGAQEQLYIEMNGMIAKANPEEGVTVWGSMQCPYYVHKALVPVFGLPPEKIRVIQMETGGGFGGKEEYPSLLAAHAALLAWKSKRPVKMIYDRKEDMVATTKRHPSRTKIRSTFDRSGKIKEIDIDFTLDGGAYATLSSVVLSRGTLHAAGPYTIPKAKIHSKVLATNSPPHGAFRGFGAPQSLFAIEKHLNHVALGLRLTPAEIRKKNFVKKGQKLACGQEITENIRLDRILDRALKVSGYLAKRKKYLKENPGKNIRRGIGFASFQHGAGFTGSGETFLASMAGARFSEKGKVEILTSNTEIGQGTNTIFSQMAADVLGLKPDDIEVAQPDTAQVPNSGPTVASRTCMIVGKLVEQACLDLQNTLFSSGLLKKKYSRADFLKAASRYKRDFGELRGKAKYSAPPHVQWDEERYQGAAYGTYAWATYVADVSVDTRTYQTTVEGFWAVQEVGKVVNPVLARGQIIGGIVQGIGYALYEEVKWKEGRMQNGTLSNYIIPTSMDVPDIQVYFEELPYKYGGGGSKGIGELPLDGPAPAIVNAVEEALGIPLFKIPLTPEFLMEELEKYS